MALENCVVMDSDENENLNNEENFCINDEYLDTHDLYVNESHTEIRAVNVHVNVNDDSSEDNFFDSTNVLSSKARPRRSH